MEIQKFQILCIKALMDKLIEKHSVPIVNWCKTQPQNPRHAVAVSGAVSISLILSLCLSLHCTLFLLRS